MSFQLQCNISLQDCATLYPTSANPLYQFTSGSCVIDTRLNGIARCGWPGAQCSIIDNPSTNTVVGGISNCAKPSKKLCPAGRCIGAVGDPCTTNDDCNTLGATCNGTICGGDMARINISNDPMNFNISTDYCLSNTTLGNITLPIYNQTSGSNSTGGNTTIQCGITPVSPSSSGDSSTTSTIAIAAGAALGVLGLLCFIAAFILWRRQRAKERSTLPGQPDENQVLPYDGTVSTPSTLVDAPSTEKFAYNRASSAASSYFPKTRSPLAGADASPATSPEPITPNRYQRRTSQVPKSPLPDSFPLRPISASSLKPLPTPTSRPKTASTLLSSRTPSDLFIGSLTYDVGIDAMDALVDGMGSDASSRHSDEFEPSKSRFNFDKYSLSSHPRPHSSAGDSASAKEDP